MQKKAFVFQYVNTISVLQASLQLSSTHQCEWIGDYSYTPVKFVLFENQGKVINFAYWVVIINEANIYVPH